MVYSELHRMAQKYMAHEKPSHALQATALINEAYLRLADSTRGRLGEPSRLLRRVRAGERRILVDWSRSRQALKRGGEIRPRRLEEALVTAPQSALDLVALDDALTALAAVDPRKSRVVELRFLAA